jgi:hypothetical protein
VLLVPVFLARIRRCLIIFNESNDVLLQAG